MPTVFVIEGSSIRGGGQTLLETVQAAGFHTLPMLDGEMTLAVLNAIRADLLVVDVSDGQTGGRRLIKEVRRNETLRQMPILAVGARPGDHESFRRLSCEVGVGGVLAEGEYSTEELVHEVRKYLAKSAGLSPSDTTYQWAN